MLMSIVMYNKPGLIAARLVLKSACLLLIVQPLSAHATNCDSKVVNVSIDAGGSVFVGTTLSPTHGVCSIIAKDQFSMQPESCKAAYALLLTAKVSMSTVRLYYSGISNCSQITGWSVQPSFYHAELL